GDDGRAQRAEGPPPRLRPGPLVVPEPVEYASGVQVRQPVTGPAQGGEGEVGEVVGGEGVVIGEEVEDEPVAGGDAGQFGGDDGRRQTDGGAGDCADRSDIPYQSVPVHGSSSASVTCACGVFQGARWGEGSALVEGP